MVDIKIFGSGCAKCVKLAENAETAAKGLGLDYSVEKVTDQNAIIDAGVLMTPALMVDGKVRSSGKVLSEEQVRSLLA
ncbi:MAG: TM0996/MTH895 family glutaredoxin-like protein [Rhodospirillales bacterium]|nr:TM0996/MTH895 family glutaredoxin-like protein [Rhodospirillales bacterium]